MLKGSNQEDGLLLLCIPKEWIPIEWVLRGKRYLKTEVRACRKYIPDLLEMVATYATRSAQ